MLQPRLAILDIDGTLTDTTAVDDECFRQAMAYSLGIPSSVIDWTDAPHITDAGICDWLFERHHKQPARTSQVAAAKADFLRRLQGEARSRPDRFAPVPGATGVISYLVTEGWAVALATGA